MCPDGKNLTRWRDAQCWNQLGFLLCPYSVDPSLWGQLLTASCTVRPWPWHTMYSTLGASPPPCCAVAAVPCQRWRLSFLDWLWDWMEGKPQCYSTYCSFALKVANKATDRNGLVFGPFLCGDAFDAHLACQGGSHHALCRQASLSVVAKKKAVTSIIF